MRGLALALTLALTGPASGADPRLRADLVGVDRARRVEIRDTRCRGGVADARRDGDLRRRIVELAAREWEAFRFPVLDLAARGLPVVPTLDAAGARPQAIVPSQLNPPRPVYTRRMLRSGLAEDAPEVALRIAGYWASVPGQGALSAQNAVWQIAPEAGWVQPWSAAFISWVMCEAGLTEAQFPRAESHAAYLAALFDRPEAAFTPRPLTELPEPGDLVCAGRGDTAAIGGLDEAHRAAAQRAALHCDVVVGRAADRLLAIGGNVENAVTLSVLPARGGRLVPTPLRPWFTVLKLRAPADPRAVLGQARFRCLGRAEVERCIDEL